MIDLRYLVVLAVLLYASYCDLRTRRSPNLLAFILGATGLIYCVAAYIDNPASFWYMGATILFMVILTALFAILRVGGADYKMILAIGIVFADNVFVTLGIVIVTCALTYVCVWAKPGWREKPPIMVSLWLGTAAMFAWSLLG